MGSSDVDLITLGFGADEAAELAGRLSERFVDRCRGVEVAAGDLAGLDGDGDEAYGNRVFLRHYAVHLAGPDLAAGLPRYPADAAAARGLNGDIARHAGRWQDALGRADVDTDALGRRLARKTLLAVAGLVSLHDRTWTTDRADAARRWGEVEPSLATSLAELLAWSDGAVVDPELRHLTTTIPAVVARFRNDVGLWDEPAPERAPGD